MCNITLVTGSMFGGKSRTLIDLIKQTHENGDTYIVLKPTTDTRDGLVVKSRDLGLTISASPWVPNDIDSRQSLFKTLEAMAKYENLGKNIFIDEGHFIPEDDMKFIVNTCKMFNINLYVSGLELSFTLEYFPSIKYLKGICNSYLFLSGRCSGCNEQNALYNILFEDGKMVKNGSQIRPGDSEYKVFCNSCFEKLT